MQCPECCGPVEVRHVRLPHFACPHCGLALCVPNRFLTAARILGAGLGLVLCYAFDMGGIAFIVGPLVGFFLIGSVLAVPLLVIAPPELEKNFHIRRTLGL